MSKKVSIKDDELQVEVMEEVDMQVDVPHSRSSSVTKEIPADQKYKITDHDQNDYSQFCRLVSALGGDYYKSSNIKPSGKYIL